MTQHDINRGSYEETQSAARFAHDMEVKSGYAGFWLRLWALIVDTIVLVIPLIGMVMASPEPSGSGSSDAWAGLFVLTYFIMPWLYFAIFESSERQATLGKQFLGLRVTDTFGHRISFARATGRYWGKSVSYIIFGLGYLMAAFTARKQTLHDMMAGCLVVREYTSAEDPNYL